MRIEFNTDENWNESELPGNRQWQLPGHFISCQSLFKNSTGKFYRWGLYLWYDRIDSFFWICCFWNSCRWLVDSQNFFNLTIRGKYLFIRLKLFKVTFRSFGVKHYLYFNTRSNDTNFVWITSRRWRDRTIIWCRTRTSLKFDYTRFGQVWPNVTTNNA